MIIAGTGVLTPIATTLAARQERERQTQLFIEGGKFCFTLGFFFTALFLLLGRPLVALWMGPELADSSRLLAIIAVGELLPMSQWITHGVLLGMGRHRTLAVLSLSESGVGIVLALVLGGPYGLPGVCVAFAVPALIFRGAGQLGFGCRAVGVTLGQYFASSALPAATAAALPAAALAVLVAWAPPETAVGLFAYTGMYALGHFGACAVFLVGPDRLQLLAGVLARKFSKAENV
jgi:membrane protein EpsK